MFNVNSSTPQSSTFDPQLVASAFAHIEQKWSDLTFGQKIDDGTVIGLPYDFVVPSRQEASTGFSFEEMYYWDSYFIAIGLLSSNHDELAAGMLENLIHLFKRFHIIPNASRTYFTGRSQPPFLTTYIFNIYEKQQKDEHWLRERLYVAEREYQTVWTQERHPNWRCVYDGLSRNYDINLIDHLAEAESGWDMNTRFQGKCLSYLPIDLNCLLYKYEVDIARGYEICGDQDTASVWRNKARLRAEKVTKYLWNDEKGFFFDFDYITQIQSPVWSLAAYYAMWSGLATTEQAQRMVNNLPNFMHLGGLVTSRHADEWMGDMPTQWAYPNGWAPLQWLTINGLESYGYNQEASAAARAWLKNNLEHFSNNGVFREAYNVVSPELPPKPGLYPPQLGFGWTNAVFVALAKKYMSEEELLLV